MEFGIHLEQSRREHARARARDGKAAPSSARLGGSALDFRFRRLRVLFYKTKTKMKPSNCRAFYAVVAMSTTSVSSSSSSSPQSARYCHTGFPDVLAERTTSLRHPDANTDPGASISAEDVDPSRALIRTRRSFLAKHKRTISSGVITAEMERQYTETEAAGLTSVDAAVMVGESGAEDGSIGRTSKDDVVVTSKPTDDLESRNSPVSPVSSPSQSKRSDDRRWDGLFSKWRKT